MAPNYSKFLKLHKTTKNTQNNINYTRALKIDPNEKTTQNTKKL